MSKMGISTYQSYCGAQIFDAVGLSAELINKYFCGTSSKVEGIGIEEIQLETEKRHDLAFGDSPLLRNDLDVGGDALFVLDVGLELGDGVGCGHIQEAHHVRIGYAWAIQLHEEAVQVVVRRVLVRMNKVAIHELLELLAMSKTESILVQDAHVQSCSLAL